MGLLYLIMIVALVSLSSLFFVVFVSRVATAPPSSQSLQGSVAMRPPLGQYRQDLEDYVNRLQLAVDAAKLETARATDAQEIRLVNSRQQDGGMRDNGKIATTPLEQQQRSSSSITVNSYNVRGAGNTVLPQQLASLGSNKSSGSISLQVEITRVTEESITKQWLQALSSKLKCLRIGKGSIYLYHTRKAAGTTVRDILMAVSAQWRVPYHETEGILLHGSFVGMAGVLSVTSLRDPVKRIMSLYWYEHVGWFDGVLKQTSRCKTLRQWVEGWRDGSAWKASFVRKNPTSVYVEIENYYVKALSGWRSGDGQVTEEHLWMAVEVVKRFDVVLLSDWMGDGTQMYVSHTASSMQSCMYAASSSSSSSVLHTSIATTAVTSPQYCTVPIHRRTVKPCTPCSPDDSPSPPATRSRGKYVLYVTHPPPPPCMHFNPTSVVPASSHRIRDATARSKLTPLLAADEVKYPTPHMPTPPTLPSSHAYTPYLLYCCCIIGRHAPTAG